MRSAKIAACLVNKALSKGCCNKFYTFCFCKTVYQSRINHIASIHPNIFLPPPKKKHTHQHEPTKKRHQTKKEQEVYINIYIVFFTYHGSTPVRTSSGISNPSQPVVKALTNRRGLGKCPIQRCGSIALGYHRGVVSTRKFPSTSRKRERIQLGENTSFKDGGDDGMTWMFCSCWIFFWSVYRILSRNVEGLKLQGSNEMMFYGEIGFLGNCFIFEFFSSHRLGNPPSIYSLRRAIFSDGWIYVYSLLGRDSPVLKFYDHSEYQSAEYRSLMVWSCFGLDMSYVLMV